MASNTQAFLRNHAPFNKMQPDALQLFADKAKIVFYAAGSEIVGPDSGKVRYFYLIESGKVQARQAGEVTVTEYSILSLGAGESFPIGAVTAGRPSTNVYKAVEDTFCYQLPAEDFLVLLASSPEFNLFCTRYIASLLDQSRCQLQLQFAQRASEQQTLNSPLVGIGSRTPITVSPETPLRAALETMSRAGVGSLVIAGEDRKAVGVFTRTDLLDRVVLAELPLSAPVNQAMSPLPFMLAEHATAYDAMYAMATHGIRHVLVTDAEGKLTGVVSERDLFSLQRVGLRQIRQSIDGAHNVEALQQAAADVRQLAFNMLAQGVGAEQLTQFISALNDALTRRVIQLNLEKHNFDGIEWGWLAFGSEGRDEQTFSTDQDNGIVFVPPVGATVDALKQRFLAYALDVNNDLDRCGFPLCKGNIMASNPQWCLTLDEWKDQFATWIRTPQPDALLNATIFFDFRALYGKAELADAMRRHLLSLTASSPMFLRAMAKNALDVEPPLGKIRDFLTDLEPGKPGKIDLKKYGSRIFVDVARIYAMASGVHNTNSIQRLRLAAQRLSIRSDEIDAVLEGLNFIQLLRLQHQYLEGEPGTQGDNLIDPDTLNELDRRILKESFRQARKIQTRLKLDYQVQ
ncbi:MAG: nucleotidyltransferase [Betaproteobacteria bacterium HGW-Betaproteobacteria-6]|nr:MAG: nucleotidyltransferase [Betaproteobacteria bacterium HGW-Betaproteobacteria-6]